MFRRFCRPVTHKAAAVRRSAFTGSLSLSEPASSGYWPGRVSSWAKWASAESGGCASRNVVMRRGSGVLRPAGVGAADAAALTAFVAQQVFLRDRVSAAAALSGIIGAWLEDLLPCPGFQLPDVEEDLPDVGRAACAGAVGGAGRVHSLPSSRREQVKS